MRGAAPPLDPDALKDARLGAGLSQDALARAVGTDRRQIIRYENGEERPEIARLAALARACGVSVEELVVEGSLPTGLAGLRIGAGMTMAAAAAALTDRLHQDIATNRASLSYAERGRLPLSWRPPNAMMRVRGALADAYNVEFALVARAWRVTFEGQGESGSQNPTSDEGATQTPPPWRSMLDAVPDLPGARREPGADVGLPFEDEQPQERDSRLELLSPQERDAFGLDAIRMWRVRLGDRLVGFVWRTDDVRQKWAGARADARGQLGAIASLSPTLHRTRQSVVEHLLDPDADFFTAPCTGQVEVDMSARIGPGWVLRRQGEAVDHTWLLVHQGRVQGMVRRYRPRGGGLSWGWEALLGTDENPGRVRRPATSAAKYGRTSNFLWRSRDLAAWGVATNPAHGQPNPKWARGT
ncbi:helix-turn-helix transcriptional regulator [Nocardiopsis alba]|uniref:helix-turn-helix transcriptional regulator n=1 Tax=Nocardiopsis alba TaxID=53437 RepID=UPI0037F49968